MNKLFSSIRNYIVHTDLFLLGLSCLAACAGLVLIYSATFTSGSNRYIYVQALAFGLGILGFVIASLIDISHISVLWKWLYLFNLLLIAALFFFGIDGGTGNKSWIRFEAFPLGIQPAEIGKIIMVFTLAQHVALLKGRLSTLLSVLQLAAHVLLISGLVYYVSKDLGMVLAYLFVGCIMIYAAGLKLRWFALGGFFIFACLPIFWNSLSSGQQSRILVVFDPSIDPDKAYHAEQSKIALGAGQFSGQGFLAGRQTQYSKLPAKHTDFIFSVAGEEFGFIGCMIIIALMVLLILRIFYVALKADTTFTYLVCVGIGATFLFQSIINIGMCVGLTPVIGLTLPFFSYGGSSLVTVFVSMGIVSGVQMRLKPKWLK